MRPPDKRRPDIRKKQERDRQRAQPKLWERTPEQHRATAATIAVRVEVSLTPGPPLDHASLDKPDFRRLLARMGFTSYAAYLWSPLWLEIRAFVLKRAKKRCEDCGRRASQVHHLHYSEENLTGKSYEGLIALCDGCHETRHRRPPA